jgi:intraflagellar transport protein 88
MRGTAQQRLGTAMKSNASAGFNSKPAGYDGNKAAKPVEGKKEKTEEQNFKDLEEEVHRILEDSARLKLAKSFVDALTKAKEAASKEKKIRQLRESGGTLDQVNIDLTFYTFYNLANIYHANNLHQEALNSYTIILKNKQYPQASRLRVNMGNIFFEQKKFE